jgi:hypothetical protein
MVHPDTGETITSYKQLVHDPATKEIWQMAFGKETEWNNKMRKQGRKERTPCSS